MVCMGRMDAAWLTLTLTLALTLALAPTLGSNPSPNPNPSPNSRMDAAWIYPRNFLQWTDHIQAEDAQGDLAGLEV